MHFVQESLPWHVRYLYYTGTLPNITGVGLASVGLEFAITEPVNCRTHTTEAQPFVAIANAESSGVITGMGPDEEELIPLEGEFLCLFAGEGTFEGTGSVTTVPSCTEGAESITVSLISGGGGEGEEASPSLCPAPTVEFSRVATEGLARRTVTINAGSEPLTVRSISLGSTSYFAVTDPNGCIGARLAERGTCSFHVLFDAPGERERTLRTTLTVETSIRTLEDAVAAST